MNKVHGIVLLMQKHKRTILLIIGNLLAGFILLNESKAQDVEGYIYGRVTTLDQVYQGQLRWDDEEAFWNDHFNATKIKNEYYDEIAERNRARNEEEKDFDWDNFNWNLSSIWEDKLRELNTHQFVCQFGDIKALTDLRRDKLTLQMKNGLEIRLDGSGTNDVGSTIIVNDEEIGEISVRWDRITDIEFLPTPRKIRVTGGRPIYGTVETYRKGIFTGFIQWDHDERLDQEKLDGDNRDGDISIPFSEIASIEKYRDGSNVILKSGREFYLTNSNDVDNDNRGIIMTVPGVGKIDIPWKYFDRATLEPAPDSGPSYNEYPPPKGLSGTVYTIRDDKVSGDIVFDMDESWELEILDGDDDDVEYKIPFRNIKSIEPKNYAYSMVTLKNGDKILLGGTQDVSDKNDGLLVFVRNNDDPAFIEWEEIVEIIFD